MTENPYELLFPEDSVDRASALIAAAISFSDGNVDAFFAQIQDVVADVAGSNDVDVISKQLLGFLASIAMLARQSLSSAEVLQRVAMGGGLPDDPENNDELDEPESIRSREVGILEFITAEVHKLREPST